MGFDWTNRVSGIRTEGEERDRLRERRLPAPVEPIEPERPLARPVDEIEEIYREHGGESGGA